MIPRLIPRGYSFKGAIAYITHDPDQALSSERVAWTATGNMLTQDPAKAAKVMAWTDMNADLLKQSVGGASTGRKVETGSVAHDILSWAIEDKPSEQQQREAVESYLKARGLSDHQYVAAGHHDTDHIHVHLIINLTHPETGYRADTRFEKRRAQAWALAYEREHGIHCHMREAHAQQRAQDNAPHFYRSKAEQYGIAVTRAYALSDNGQAFSASLQAEGLTLARGRKSFVAVSGEGEVLNLSRVIEGAKTKEIKAKLGDLDRAALQDADALAAQIKARREEEQATQRKADALAMLADMVEDELEDERIQAYDTDATQDPVKPADTLDQEEVQSMQIRDDLDMHDSPRDPRTSDLSSITYDDPAEHHPLHPISEQGESGRDATRTRQAASGEIQDHARDFESGAGECIEADIYDSEQARIDAHNRLLDAADAYAQALSVEQGKNNQIVPRGLNDERQAVREENALRKQHYDAAKERIITAKIKDSEELRQHQAARDNLRQAQIDFDKYNTFWRKLFQYEKYWEAKDTLHNRRRQLEDAEARARSYLDYMDSQRPHNPHQKPSAEAQVLLLEPSQTLMQQRDETQALTSLLAEHTADQEARQNLPTADQLMAEYEALVARGNQVLRETISADYHLQGEENGLEQD
jgi:hypothetical protein